MHLDNRVRFIVCLLATVVLLSASPFLWAKPSSAAEVRLPEEAAGLSDLDATPSDEEGEGPAVLPDQPIPVIPEPDTLTDHQRYIESLVEPDSTNLLICAPDPSAWNMDTIVIASISPSTGKISIISLPRDIYIHYSDALESSVETLFPGLMDEPGMRKINAAHAIGDKLHYKEGTGRFDRPYIEFLSDLLEEVFAIHIDDYVYLQTRGFRRIVDYFGGVSIDVPIRMLYSDPLQGLSIDLQPGKQVLDGTQAESFVRFRQGYDDAGAFTNYGDVFRKENQTRFLKAFIKQHLTLRNLTRLSDISSFIGKNVITSARSWDQIVLYGALAEKSVAEKYPISTVVLKLTEARIHGLSYVLLEEAGGPPDPQASAPAGEDPAERRSRPDSSFPPGAPIGGMDGAQSVKPAAGG